MRLARSHTLFVALAAAVGLLALVWISETSTGPNDRCLTRPEDQTLCEAVIRTAAAAVLAVNPEILTVEPDTRRNGRHPRVEHSGFAVWSTAEPDEQLFLRPPEYEPEPGWNHGMWAIDYRTPGVAGVIWLTSDLQELGRSETELIGATGEP